MHHMQRKYEFELAHWLYRVQGRNAKRMSWHKACGDGKCGNHTLEYKEVL